ncbi:9358_t:CDS:2 [Ambispora leptoticha]|uniref:9358_t:CDS:1 n=1 Tax=Ambispora leptoticha TaxID=144679 RepID=A0A9N9BVY5_9GLOM|nr:9358_t:CDS:2 [Ambispora leptoticha]
MGSLYTIKEGRITTKKIGKKSASKLEQPELFDDDFDFSNLSEGRFGLTLKQTSLTPFTETDFEGVSSLTSKHSERNVIKSKSQKSSSSSSSSISSKSFESEDDIFKHVHFSESMESLVIASPQSTHLSSINENSSQDDFWSDLIIDDDHVFSLQHVQNRNNVSDTKSEALNMSRIDPTYFDKVSTDNRKISHNTLESTTVTVASKDSRNKSHQRHRHSSSSTSNKNLKTKSDIKVTQKKSSLNPTTKNTTTATTNIKNKNNITSKKIMNTAKKITIKTNYTVSSKDIAEHNQSDAKPDSDDNQNTVRRKWRKKPTLIRNLNSTKRSKVVGEMVYNPDLQQWDGNESILKEFEAYLTPRNKPTLNTKFGTTKNDKITENMIFDPEKMCWCSNQKNLEEDVFKNFENSDGDDDYDKKKYHKQEEDEFSNNDSHSISDNSNLNGYNICNKDPDNLVMSGNNSNEFTVGNEFDITPGFLAALIASERQHGNEMSRWYPAASSLRNEQRFGLRNPNIQRGFLYEIRTVVMNNKKSCRFNSRRDRFVK